MSLETETTPARPSLIYKALRTHRKEIRLLVISPGQYEDDLLLDLVTVSLLHRPSYHALSYCWADDEHEEEVLIAGEKCLVRKNVVQGIRRLRLPLESARVWIDAICINQLDYDERGHQVAMMVDVYSQAALVHVWLGEDFSAEQKAAPSFQDQKVAADCDGSRERLPTGFGHNPLKLEKGDNSFRDALHIAQRLADGAHVHEAFEECHLDSSRHMVTSRRWIDAMNILVAIVTRPWWRRVWVLQEVILPRTEPLVHFSKYTFGLSLILNCCSNCMKHCSTCCLVPERTGTMLYTGDVQGKFPPDSFGNVGYLQNVKRRFDSEQLGLWGALEVSRMRETTDLRDHFYGVLGLVETFYREMASPDYQSPTAKVFGEATALVVIENRCLRHLRYAVGNVGHDENEYTLPSWTVDLANDRAPSISYDGFHAYGTAPFREHWSNRILNSRHLYVYAIKIGTVSKTLWNEAGFRQPWEQIKRLSESFDAAKACGEKAANSQRFWRVLMHGQYDTRSRDHSLRRIHTDDMSNIISWWHSLVRCQTGDAVHEGPLTTHAVFDTLYRSRLDQLDSRYFITDTSHLGARIGEVREGDGLYVLSGCEAPVILRPVSGSGSFDDSTGRHFAFCGQCYVDGMMDGEALLDGKPWEDIVLC